MKFIYFSSDSTDRTFTSHPTPCDWFTTVTIKQSQKKNDFLVLLSNNKKIILLLCWLAQKKKTAEGKKRIMQPSPTPSHEKRKKRPPPQKKVKRTTAHLPWSTHRPLRCCCCALIIYLHCWSGRDCGVMADSLHLCIALPHFPSCPD